MTKCKFQKPDGRCKNKGTTTYDGFCKRHYDIVQRESESKEEIELQEVPDLDLSDNSVPNTDNQHDDELVEDPIVTVTEEQEPEANIEETQLEETEPQEVFEEEVVKLDSTILEEYDEEPVVDEEVQNEQEVANLKDSTIWYDQMLQMPPLTTEQLTMTEQPVNDEQSAMNDQEYDEVEVEELAECAQEKQEETESESNVIIEEEQTTLPTNPPLTIKLADGSTVDIPYAEDCDDDPIDDNQPRHVLEEEPSQQVTEEVEVVDMTDAYTVPIEQPTEVIEDVQEENKNDAYESLQQHLVRDVPTEPVDNSDYERQEIVRSKGLSTSSTAIKARGHRSQVKIPEPKGILKATEKTDNTRSAKRVRFDENVKTKRISPPSTERVAKVNGLEVTVEEKKPEIIEEPKEQKVADAPEPVEEEQEIPNATSTSDWVLSQADRKKTLSPLALSQAAKKASVTAVFVPDYKEAIRLAHSRDGFLLLNSFAAGFLDQWVGNFHNRTFHLTESLSIKVTGTKSVDLLKQKLTTTHQQLASYAASLEEANALLINEPKFVFYVASHPLHWRPEESEGTGTLDRYLWCTTSIKDAVNKANSCERHWKPVLVIVRVLSGKYTIPYNEPGVKKGKLLLLPQNNIKWVSSRPHQSKPGEMSHRIFEGDSNVVGPHVSLYKLTVSN